FVDAQVAKLLEALDSGPHAENTVVVLWSDHGWHLGEKRHWGKWTGWERSTRVPLVIVPAKADRGRFRTGEVSREPVSLLDLYPTLVDLCRLTPRAGLDGVSLVPLLRRPDAETRRTVITTFGAGNHTLRSRHWRYIRYADGSEELYDHRNDSREWRNLAEDPQHAAVRDDLRQRLAAKLE
ncbi:MAG: sulfatase-like hydrolase/transferase, partial [Planctomycetota bacterium]|nr:sulfatase-like hydrolase/transferase [Planctomycetota bacterium]